MRVLAISGSLRREAHNSALLRAAVERLPAVAEVEAFERIAEIPAFDADLEDGPVPGPVVELREAAQGADAILIATPEYNGSIPGALKNALDWASRPAGESSFAGAPTVVIGASTGQFGAAWSQAELRKVLGRMGARVIDGELAIGKAHELGRDRIGALELSSAQLDRLDQLLAVLISTADERTGAPALSL